MSHLTSKYKSTPTFSFKGRYDTSSMTKESKQSPSPQQYEVNSHHLAKNITKSVKFPQQRRSCSFDYSQELPGPGQYESTPHQQSVSFHKGETLNKGQQRFTKPKFITPAPSNYNVKYINKTSGPQFSIGRHLRSLSQLSGNKHSPAPCLYNPSFVSQEHNASISFVQAKRKDSTQPVKTPGPGSYESEQPFVSTSFNQKRVTLPRAHRQSVYSDEEKCPGPGAYPVTSDFLQDRKKNKGYTWDRSLSTPRIQSVAVPGPGQYDPTSLKHKYKVHEGVKMAKSERTFMTKFNLTPGPGDHESTYGQTSKFRSVSASKFPKANKLGRFLQKANDHQADYVNPEKLNTNKTSTISFSLAQSQRKPLFEKEITDKIYDPSDRLTKKEQHGYKMTKAERIKSNIVSTVGPGAYESPSTLVMAKKTKFSKEKRHSFVDEVIKSKLNNGRGQTYQSREQFPNPPKYMNVHKKLQINEKKITKY